MWRRQINCWTWPSAAHICSTVHGNSGSAVMSRSWSASQSARCDIVWPIARAIAILVDSGIDSDDAANIRRAARSFSEATLSSVDRRAKPNAFQAFSANLGSISSRAISSSRVYRGAFAS